MLVRVGVACALTAALVSFGTATNAATLQLSDLSSDATPASDLDAVLETSVNGSNLVLTLSNDSNYEITEIYFNFTDNVTSLSEKGNFPSGWSLQLFDQPTDGFGSFDAALVLVGTTSIPSFGSEQFPMKIQGTTPFLDTDFTTEFSNVLGGGTASWAAAKFENGPGGDFAFGASTPNASTPEPHSMLLFGAGGLIVGLAVRRRLTTGG